MQVFKLNNVAGEAVREKHQRTQGSARNKNREPKK